MAAIFDFVGNIFDSLFGGDDDPVRQAPAVEATPIPEATPVVATPAPVVESATPMPTASVLPVSPSPLTGDQTFGDAENTKVRKRSIASQMQRRGRASTILTQYDAAGADTLGG